MLDDELATRAYSDDPAGWSVLTELGHFLRDWRGIVEGYWGLRATTCPADLPEAKWRALKEWAELSDVMMEMVRSMTVFSTNRLSARDTVGVIREGLAAHSRSPIVRQLLEIQVAEALSKRLRGAGTRASEVLAQLQPEPRNRHTNEYLTRLSDLYLAGFETEVPVVARAALEHALKECLQNRGASTSGTLEALLLRANGAGLLPEQRKRRPGDSQLAPRPSSPLWHADRVRSAGNYVVHTLPAFRPPDDGPSSAREVLASLAVALDSLYSS